MMANSFQLALLKNSISRLSQFSTSITSFPLFNDRPTTFYVCGPTVYDHAHIGHARTYVCFDIIRRILTDFFKADISLSMGITDIDDKIIQRARQSGDIDNISPLTRSLENSFFDDMDSLRVRRPDFVLRVSEHVDDIITYIKQIENNGYAYLASDGLYFHVPKLGKAYGKLCRIPPDDRNTESVGNLGTTGIPLKKDKRDFVLWKLAKSGEPYWQSPWGPGRPGWHIECSAMINAVFGADLDVHGGGVDLMFPHHTNEIAQCEAHNGREGWVKRWIHTGHLYIEGRKMSKSLKNFITIREFMESDWTSSPSDDFRLFCLQHKYSATLHFTQDRIIEAGSFRRRVESFLQQVSSLQATATVLPQPTTHVTTLPSTPAYRSCKATTASLTLTHRLTQSRVEVGRALGDDFDTPTVLRVLSELMGSATQHCLMCTREQHEPLEPVLAVREYVLHILDMLGLPWKTSLTTASDTAHKDVVTREDLCAALVSFRASVRSLALKAVKNTKHAEKTATTTVMSPDDERGPQVEAGSNISTTLQEILVECDRVRDEIAPKLGVHIKDSSPSIK